MSDPQHGERYGGSEEQYGGTHEQYGGPDAEYGGAHDEEHRGADDDRPRRRVRKRRRGRTLAFVIVLVVVLGGGGLLAVGPVKEIVSSFSSGGDYDGEGTGSVEITVPKGTTGQGVAGILVEKDVIKSAKPFLKAVEASGEQVQAGDYTMKKQMSGAAAFQLISNPPKLPTMAIPEGFRLTQIVDRIVKTTGLPKADVEAATKKKPSAYGVSADFPNLEGLLFPATYEIKPDESAEQIVQEMVDRYKQEIADLGIKDSDVVKTMTLASLVQVESPGDEDVRKKVARVFLNRIDPSNHETAGRLQSDATVAYIHGARDDLTTTAEERNSDSPYNTYKVKGLPPGPINSPGRGALEAALEPADGPWLYFVATDPDTGETAFATTYAEHQQNVKKYQEWLAEHKK